MLLTDTIASEIPWLRTDRVSLEAIAGPNVLSKDYLIVNRMHMIELTTEDSREVTLLRVQPKHERAVILW